MKSRNLFLSLLAVLIAVGSAVASFSTLADPINDYVFVSGTCRQIAEQPCNSSTTNPCRVTVTVNGVSQGAFVVYDENLSGCASPKTDSRLTPIAVVAL